ncbi:MAG: alpha/beta hydrolase [Gammaproteobacteria bacterium]|jgi:pimeloyl-ACP methyl ester carboxylesterase|nr:alpha/beta hydrolase [Gammaproteobacteria bacterium]MBT4491716.1 alpha/beta hydrolase [Gammaproteobacteria bacterium]MBT7369464.1 alpha/beta hydrolase [Gammaproteobacteria bacterium]
MNDRKTKIAVATGLSLHVTEWGAVDGFPILILHGGGHDATCWAEVCHSLPDKYRCILPDARGHGQSDWSESGDYSCQSQVEDLISLLEILEIDQCVIAGHSMGGLNALLLAGSCPERTAGLILVDVGTETQDTGMKRVREAREKRAKSAPVRQYDVTPAKSDARLAEHVPTYLGDSQYRRELLKKADAPLLVIRGQRSGIMPLESAQATADLVGGMVREVPNSGHAVSLANPVATAGAIEEFLDSLNE